MQVNMIKRQAKTALSSDLVKYFRRQGLTLHEIAEKIEVSESFISRVANKERSFTIEHLLMLERSTREPLPLLLLHAMDEATIPNGLSPLYQTARNLLFAGSELKNLLEKSPSDSSSNLNRE
jgi:transcriptional regulator with XRE-family HTH domain